MSTCEFCFNSLCECGLCFDCQDDPGQCSECNLCMSCHFNTEICDCCERVMGDCTTHLCCRECNSCTECAIYGCDRPRCFECERGCRVICEKCNRCIECSNNAKCCRLGPNGELRCVQCRKYEFDVCTRCKKCWDCDSPDHCKDSLCRLCLRQHESVRWKEVYSAYKTQGTQLNRLNWDVMKKIRSFYAQS